MDMGNTIMRTDSFIVELGIERSKLYIFFEAPLLAKALTKSCHNVSPVRAPPAEEHNEIVQLPRAHGLEKGSQCYLNKLAHLCSNTPGSGDITAIALLRDPETRAVFYLIGSNNRNEKELEDTAQFVQSLFETLNVKDSLLEKEMSRIADDLMRKILLFHERKLKAYVNGVLNEVNHCIWTDEDHPICLQLRDMKSCVERCKEVTEKMCRRSFATSASDEESVRQCYISSIRSLFPKLEALRRAIGFVHNQSMSGNQESTWGSLLHYIGRILSYASAPEILIASRQAWPEIFSPSIELVLIPSSKPMSNPFPPKRKRCVAADLINRVFNNPTDRQICLQQAEKRQNMTTPNLDALLKEEFDSRSFRPFVHCEILLHDWILRWAEGAIRPDIFYFPTMYIGVGKPTCRSCWTYLSNHHSGVSVRKSSLNIYPAWRMPDSYRAVDLDAESERLRVIEKIKEDFRLLSKRTLADGRARKKERDTETSSSRPSVAGGFLAGVRVFGGSQHAGPARMMSGDRNGFESPSEWRMGSSSRDSGEGRRFIDSGMGLVRPPSSVANESISWGEEKVEESLANLSLDRGSSTSRISTDSSTGASSGSISGGEGSSLGSPGSSGRAAGNSETSDGDSDDDGGGVVLFRGRGGKATGGRGQ